MGGFAVRIDTLLIHDVNQPSFSAMEALVSVVIPSNLIGPIQPSLTRSYMKATSPVSRGQRGPYITVPI